MPKPAAQTIPFPTKTARFRAVVERCGRPEVHLSLVAPAQDRALRALEKHGRVMTVWQSHRGGADHGQMGIFTQPGVQYLIFDRSLRAFAGRRIVGIDYSLLESAAPEARPAAIEWSAVPSPRAKKRPASPARPPKARAGEVPKLEEVSEPPEEEADVQPPAPPDAPEIKRELQQIARLLAAKRYAAARDRVNELVRRMGEGE